MKAIDFIEQEIKLEGDGGYLSKKNLAFLLESFAKRQVDDKEKISLHTEQLYCSAPVLICGHFYISKTSFCQIYTQSGTVIRIEN